MSAGSPGPRSRWTWIPSTSDLIPANVVAEIKATTVFGNKYISFSSPENPVPQRITSADVIDVTAVTTEFNTLFETVVSVAEKVDPVKLNQTLTATAQALDGLGDRFGQSLIHGNEILADLNPRQPQLRYDVQRLADLAEVYADASPDLWDGLENAVTTARTLNEQQGNLDQTLMASIGFGNTGGDIFERGGPYLVRGAEDLIPSAQLLDEYSPALFCTIRNFHDVAPKVAAPLGGNGYSLRTHSQILGASNPYVYPDNLPRVNAKGGPEGRPGCWQPVTRDLWPQPYLVMDTGASHRAVQPPRTRPADPDRVRLGPPGRGEHDQSMKITGTAIKLGAFSLVLLLFTAIIIVVFGQIRFDRTTGYSAVFSNASGLRAGQFVRASGVEVGKVSKVELIDGGERVRVDFKVDRSLPLFDEIDRVHPLPESDRRPLPGTQARRQRQAAAGRWNHSRGAHRAGARPGRVGRRVPAAVPGAGSGEGQQHRLVAHHDLPGTGRHHQRHPRPDRCSSPRRWPTGTRRSAR